MAAVAGAALLAGLGLLLAVLPAAAGVDSELVLVEAATELEVARESVR
ncbi:hypothetical protein ACX80E_16405 [Arthrobacter sp. TMN-49]